jgi:Fic family protein
LIASNDSIMKPPYSITPKILKLVSSISEKIGEVNANLLNRPSPQLRKLNKIKTIQSSLSIEGNTLNMEQVTAIIENKKVAGPKKDILEVTNAIIAYENLVNFDSLSQESFLQAHSQMMENLIENSGKYRNQAVGIIKGSNVTHIAPPAKNIPFLMNDLFEYLKNQEELCLIKSCVFHYEMEFIHPFFDGNGRMGRLWQTVILLSKYSVFEFLPFETLIKQTQDGYYEALAFSDKNGESTIFIEYMLGVIEKSLSELLNYNNRILSDTDRIEYFRASGKKEFSRKDYMNVFKDISTATASRDLKKAVDLNLFEKAGSKNKTVYKLSR